jgi:putative colanic acid biosynthesis UDP-glucose lipid carrier transferase
MRADTALLLGGAPRRRRRSGADWRFIADGLVRLGDVLVVALSGLLASQFRFDGLDHPDIVTVALLTGVLLAGNIFGLLKVYDFERITRLNHQLPRLIGGWAVTVALVLAVLYAMRSAGGLSRLWVGYWFLAGAAGLLLWRYAVKRLIEGARAKGQLCRRLVLVGDGNLTADCIVRLRANDQGLAVVGALVLDGTAPALPPGCARLYDLTALEPAIRDLEADQIILAIPFGRPNEIQALVRSLKNLPVEISLYPDMVGAGLPLFGLTRVGDALLVQLMQRPLDGWQYVLKCVEDRVLAVLLLAIATPALVAIALAIRLSSPGPVFYRQLRHGFNREPILVFKFRTMYADLCDPPGATRVQQATCDDPRVTPLGRVLRRTSLDELPQLLNVLRGEMSLVGPRPHAVAHDDQYSALIDDYLGRQRMKPGITGWAQINGHRGETRTVDQMRRRIELDLEYIKSWSLLIDLRILIRTTFMGFGGPHAH